MFLTRRLAMWQHLERRAAPQGGPPLLVPNEHVHGHADASETGGFLRSAVPSFQLRRDALDEHLLATAVAEGATLLRPARVRDVELGDFDHRVTIEQDGGVRDGRLPLGARRHRPRHLPRQAARADRQERASIPPRRSGAAGRTCATSTTSPRAGRGAFPRRGLGSRRLSTNHYMGFGYWIWVIPLGQRRDEHRRRLRHAALIGLSESRDRERDFRAFLRAIPALAELLEGAELARRGPALLLVPALRHPPVHGAGLGAPRRRRGVPRSLLLAGAGSRRVHRRGHRRDHQGRSGGGAVRRAHRRAQRDLRALLPPLLPGGLPGQVLLHGRARPPRRRPSCIDTAQYYIFVVIPAYRVLGRFHWMPVLGPRRGVAELPLHAHLQPPLQGASRSPAAASATRAGATTAGASSPTSRSTGRRSA